MRRAVALALVCVAAACGPRKPTPAELEAARQAAELRARAETRVLEGCYDCLLEAKAAYSRLATGADRPPMLVRLFEVELLLGLREKELAIDATASLGRARALVPELPPPAAVAAERYLAAAEAAVPDETGLSVAAGRSFRRSTAKYVEGLDAEIGWLLSDSSFQLPVRQYVALALDCAYFRRGRPIQRPPTVTGQPIPATPTRPVVMEQVGAGAAAVVRYRAGFCDIIRRAPLEQVRKEEARYAEAAYFLARLDIARAQETGAPGARQLLAEAYGRFPQSPAVTYLNGNYQQLIGDCKEALRFYLETIAIEKLHDNALLGRTVCLAFLKRFDESMASATEMIEIPSSNLA
jgi:tetratricopeptide (TPR) repeat protein